METNNNIEHPREEKHFSSINKENNFSVPQNYFDYLPEEIMDKIRLKSKEEKQFSFFKPSILIPSLAVLSGVILLLVFFFNNDIPSDEEMLSEIEVQQVIDNPGLYNIDETAITEEYLSLNIPTESMSSETNVSDEEIKSYLEEYTDVSNIINEL